MDTTLTLLEAYAAKRTASARYTAAFEAAKTLTRASADELCAAHIALNLAVGIEFDARAVAAPAELLAYYEAEHERISTYYDSLPTSGVEMAAIRFHAYNERARAWQKVLDARANLLTDAEREEEADACGAAYYHQQAA